MLHALSQMLMLNQINYVTFKHHCKEVKLILALIKCLLWAHWLRISG